MCKLSNSGKKAVTFISSSMYAANHIGIFMEWQTKKNDLNPTYTLIKATELHHFKPEILTPSDAEQILLHMRWLDIGSTYILIRSMSINPWDQC